MDKKQPKGFSQPPTTQDLYRLEAHELKQEIKRLREEIADILAALACGAYPVEDIEHRLTMLLAESEVGDGGEIPMPESRS